MKKYRTNNEDEQYRLLLPENQEIQPPQILPSSDSSFFDTSQTYESGYPSHIVPEPPKAPPLLATDEVNKDELPETPSVFNFDKLSSNFSEGEYLEEPITYLNPYVHYVPYVIERDSKRKKVAVYINYLADYNVSDFYANNYQSFIDNYINNR